MKNPYQHLANELDWKGLGADYFKKYKSWINSSHPGLCGSYCSAVLFDDYLIKKEGIYLNKDSLLKGFKSVVDDFMPYRGTFVWDLYYGLSYMAAALEDRAPSVKMGLIPDQQALAILASEHPRPIIIGTTSVLNAYYKNHWLIATAYAFDDQGKLFFKCYDNHGRIDAVVPASQSFSYLYLQ